MTIEQLRNVHPVRPFRPFSIRMADGRSFHVPHAEFVSRSLSRRSVIVNRAGDSFSIIDPRMVNEIEVHKPASAPREGDGDG